MKNNAIALTALLVMAQSAMPVLAEDMKAAVVSGGKLTLQARPVPTPAANEIRIKVRAAGVNPVDTRYSSREGAVPGIDVSGTVDAVGAGVSAWKKGDEVIAMATAAGYAEYVTVPLERVARKPRKASFEEAAGIPVVGETAYRSLVEVAHLSKGQRILIHGGAGGVGSAAVQIAKSLGAYVIATASPRNHDFLRSIGADEVIDYNAVRFEDKVRNLDVVLNTVDVDTGKRSLGIIKPNGILVSVVQGNSAEECAAAKVRCDRPDRASGPSISALMTKVVELIDAGKYKVNVDQTFELADAQEAWDVSRQKHTRGKLVIRVAS